MWCLAHLFLLFIFGLRWPALQIFSPLKSVFSNKNNNNRYNVCLRVTFSKSILTWCNEHERPLRSRADAKAFNNICLLNCTILMLERLQLPSLSMAPEAISIFLCLTEPTELEPLFQERSMFTAINSSKQTSGTEGFGGGVGKWPLTPVDI